jgi:SAM-dependent methyltransferase
MRLIEPHRKPTVLDIGCGEGIFARALAAAGATVYASDISPELITAARARSSPDIVYAVTPGADQSFVSDQSIDVVQAILSLQNMEKIEPVFRECARVLKPAGRGIFVLNHPVFRIPQSTHWGYDEAANVQYRRIDQYLTPHRITIDMHPGRATTSVTYSFHRSLQDYTKALYSAGLLIARCEEWISPRVSEPGPRAAAENRSRREFPLFLMLEVVRSSPGDNRSGQTLSELAS